MLVTPNRLTFGLPNEIIDPYHFVEYDATELRALCAPVFDRVEVLGLFGSDRYQALVDVEHRELARLLRLDPLALRRFLPRRLRQRMYDLRLRSSRAVPQPGALEIGPEDFNLAPGSLEVALDLVAVCDRS